MDRVKALYRLDLDDDLVFDEIVQPISTIEPMPSINDRKRLLTLELQSAIEHFVSDARVIRRFEEPRPKLAVHSDCGADDPSRDVVDVGCHASSPCKKPGTSRRGFS